MKRILRDALILILVCGVFYLTARAVTTLSNTDEKPFSEDRMLADQYLGERNWPQAAVHFSKLTDRDPYNGYAWFSQASCYVWIRNELLDEVRQLKENGGTEAEIQALTDKLTETEDKLLGLLDQSMDFLRYRKRAMINKSVVLVARKQWDPAMDLLQAYLEGGDFVNRTLESMSGFGRGGREMSGRDPETEENAKLHCFPRFWELVELEFEIRRGF